MSNMDDDLDFGVTLDNGDDQPTQRAIAKEKKQSKIQEKPLKENEDSYTVGAKDFQLSRASHPVVCVFAVAFKICALFFYLIIGLFISEVITFIIVVIFTALDFWVTKNVSGRLLVGLRWWSTVDEKGNQIWKFQSRNQQDASNSVDKLFFWSGQFLSTLVWGLFFVLNILSLDLFWAWLNFICWSINFTNLYGYYQCRGEHSKKLNKLKTKGLMNIAGKFL